MPGLISLDFQGRRYKTELPVLIIFINGHGDLTMEVRFIIKCALDLLEKTIDDKLLIAVFEDSSDEEFEQGHKLPDLSNYLIRLNTNYGVKSSLVI